jgi:hypothetical protein
MFFLHVVERPVVARLDLLVRMNTVGIGERKQRETHWN